MSRNYSHFSPAVAAAFERADAAYLRGDGKAVEKELANALRVATPGEIERVRKALARKK